MKVVIFAHTPPPMHGQSYMVKLMLDGLGGDARARKDGRDEATNRDPIECFHVNARFSDELGEIGLFSFSKVLRVFAYCFEAIWCRCRYGADTLYYIPAPPKRMALYRDFVILLICRPAFRHLVFHWEASGLGEWVQHSATSWERGIARWLLGSPDLSITLATALSHDAEYFCSKRIQVIPNGIPDPCCDFAEVVLPLRSARFRSRGESLLPEPGALDGEQIYRVAFLAHCTREKGLFDALDAVVLANEFLAGQKLPVRVQLTVAGAFLREDERLKFDSWQKGHPEAAHYAGFLAQEAKEELLRRSDGLCFPTYYSAEAQPVAIVEAMAFGLTIVATAWRGIPELLPSGYPFLVQNHDPAAIAQALIESMKAELAAELRQRYRHSFTVERFVESLTQAFNSIAAGHS